MRRETVTGKKEMKNKAETTKTLLWKVWRLLSCVQSCDSQVRCSKSPKGELISHSVVREEKHWKTLDQLTTNCKWWPEETGKPYVKHTNTVHTVHIYLYVQVLIVGKLIYTLYTQTCAVYSKRMCFVLKVDDQL